MTPIIRLEHINKQFPGVHALTDIDVSFNVGEVHALVGENGAGKSTLIKIMMGAYQPTSGTVYVNGRETKIAHPLEASRMGIEAVHQELMLIPWLSVTRNIFMNREIKNPGTGLFDMKKMAEISRELLADFGVDIDVSRPTKEYSASVWKMIDIARVINLNPKVVIFDEPTAILTKPQVESLFRKIKELKANGVAIVYISHRLTEISQIVDRITILRDGRLISTTGADEIGRDEIVKRMVGRDVSSYYNRTVVEPGEELLRLENVTLAKGQEDVSLSVRRGEIVGLAGLVGSGRTEVAESIFGMNRILKGTVYYKGEPVRPKSMGMMIDKGCCLVPENRKYEGLVLQFSVACNLGLSVFGRWSRLFYNRKAEAENADRMIDRLSIKTPSRKQVMSNLSGGNQQKVVIGKAMVTRSELIVYDEPTVGVDIGAKEEIHNQMNDFVKNGGGILMISSDLPEIIGMCDRVYVMYEGKIVKELQRSRLSDENIAKYMLSSGQGGNHD